MARIISGGARRSETWPTEMKQPRQPDYDRLLVLGIGVLVIGTIWCLAAKLFLSPEFSLWFRSVHLFS